MNPDAPLARSDDGPLPLPRNAVLLAAGNPR